MRESGEMYLETILVLGKRKRTVRAIDVAEEMGLSRPSVSRGMAKLREAECILVESDGNLIFTEKGQKIAEKIYERHQILSRLFRKLGVSEETAAEDACRIEHVISDETFTALKACEENAEVNDSGGKRRPLSEYEAAEFFESSVRLQNPRRKGIISRFSGETGAEEEEYVDNNNGDMNSRKPLIYYVIIAVTILLLLNTFIFPLLLARQVQVVGYSDFLSWVDEGKVSEVSLTQQADQILFVAKNDQGQEELYKTAVFPDEGLITRLQNAGVRFSAEIPTQNNTLLSFVFSWILPILIFVGLGRLLSNQLGKRMGGGMNALSFGKANAKMIVADKETGVTFADVAGEEEAKDALKEIVDFLEHPDKYAGIGAKLPKGALLVGPPGTGKTLLAKAVAGEAKVPFFSISGSEFVEMFVGMGAAKVRDLFKQANEKAPCIVFIDEIDTIGKKRDGAGAIGGNDEREQTLNQLLTEMDGFDGKKGVVILAATNRPESLDPALLRPGRFDRRVPVELPDLQGREAILRVHAKDVKCEDGIDLKEIARATSGASGAELANIINEAALRAVRLGRNRGEPGRPDGERGDGHRRIPAEERGHVRAGEADRILP